MVTETLGGPDRAAAAVLAERLDLTARGRSGSDTRHAGTATSSSITRGIAR